MSITLTQAQAQLQAWIEADAAVAGGQAYSLGNRSLTRVDAGEITAKIDYWQRQVSRLQNGGGGMRVRYGVSE